jgi:hypothetical protein
MNPHPHSPLDELRRLAPPPAEPVPAAAVDPPVRAGYPDDYPIHPEPGGLLPWGATSNGHLLCWVITGEPVDG